MVLYHSWNLIFRRFPHLLRKLRKILITYTNTSKLLPEKTFDVTDPGKPTTRYCLLDLKNKIKKYNPVRSIHLSLNSEFKINKNTYHCNNNTFKVYNKRICWPFCHPKLALLPLIFQTFCLLVSRSVLLYTFCSTISKIVKKINLKKTITILKL